MIPPRLVVLTGASGSGKTTIARAIAAARPETIDVFRFDQIGVPRLEEMIAEYGSGEAWQRAMTVRWMRKFAAMPDDGRGILFEGQMRLAFIAEAATLAGLGKYKLILVDCDDATRAERLRVNREQAELANPTMMNWAKFLRDEATVAGVEILDTSSIPLEVGVERVLRYFDQRASRWTTSS